MVTVGLSVILFFNFKKRKRFKKRIIFSILFTSVILALSNNIWLVEVEEHKYSFELDMFFIILVLSFLLTYKLSNYLAEFKTINKKSRADIVFLFIFFILSLLPMSHIDNGLKAKHENRFLATYKPLINDEGKLNYEFGNDFEKFFNDRFFLRSFIVSNFNFIKAICAYKYYETHNAIYIKDKNYVLSKKHVPKPNIYNKDKIFKIAQSLDRFQDFCNKYHIKLYVMIVPYSQHVYQEDIKPFDNQGALIDINKNIDLLINKTKANVIYPFDELKEASKKERTFFKVDHHWTDWGAYIGYRELMKQINKDYPKLKALEESDFNFNYSKKIRKDLSRKFGYGNQINNEASFLLPIKKIILDEQYRYFEYKNKDLIVRKIYNNENLKGEKTYYKNGADLRTIEMGNSMNNNLSPFIQSTFKNTKYYYLNDVKDRAGSEQYKLMKYYKKDILDFKPDIIILCITNTILSKINDFFLEEEN